MSTPNSRYRSARVETLSEWPSAGSVDLFLTTLGYEARSEQHLALPSVTATRRLSVGFSTEPDQEDSMRGQQQATQLQARRLRLESAGFEIDVVDDDGFRDLVDAELDSVVSDTAPHVVADISSMNRLRIGSLIMACASRRFVKGLTLDLVYFPSTFDSHKREYEPLESFGPVHQRVAGWAVEPDFPVAVVLGLGTEPKRGEGIAESLEPDILSLFLPAGDEDAFIAEIQTENQRLLEVGGEPIVYHIREPKITYDLLRANVERLSSRARVVVIPLGPKIFAALAMNVALELGPQVGVWRASSGRGAEELDVQGHKVPVLARLSFDSEL